MTFIPRGPVPPSVPLSMGVIAVMTLGWALDLVNVVGFVVVSIAAVVYALWTINTGTSGGTAE